MTIDKEPRVISFGATDVGRVRKNNEDSFAIFGDGDENFWWGIVCDGLGGAAAGEVASRLAVDHFQTRMDQLDPAGITAAGLAGLAAEINLEVTRAANGNPEWRAMGTTLAALIVQPKERVAFVVHVGDSRVYLLRDEEMLPLTRDHNVSEELMEISAEAGFPPIRFGTGQELTRCIGLEPFPGADIEELDLEQGDRFLICSDGLTNVLSEAIIQDILGKGSPREAAECFIARTLQTGAVDNVTVIVAEYI